MMNKTKRILAALVALSTLLLSLPALAGAGDITIFRSGEDGRYESMRTLAYYDSTLYMFSYGNTYYTWTREAGAVAEHKFDDSAIIQEEGGYANINSVIAGADGLYALVVTSDYSEEDGGGSSVREARLHKVLISESGDAAIGEGVELDWDDMISYYDDGDYSREMRFPFITGNSLSFATYGDNGSSNQIFVYDIETGDYEMYELETDEDEMNVLGYCLYKENMGLVGSYNYGEGEAVTFYAVDLETGDLDRLFELPLTNYMTPTNFLYDEEADMFYFTLEGELKRVTGFDPATLESVAAVQIDSWSETRPVLTEDGYFICADYQTVIARSVDPDARAAHKLTVNTGYNRALESAYYTFAAKHPDTDVVLSQSYSDITEAMMNQSAAVDIYTQYTSAESFGALYERGYLAELESAALSALVAEMYPAVQAAVMKDGQLLALPVEMYSGNTPSFNLKAFEKLGLSEDDAPKTWKQYFNFLRDLPEKMEDTDVMPFDPYITQQDARNQLFYLLIESYMNHIKRADGAEMAFDTPILNEAMEALEEIDFAALGLPEEYESDSYSYDDSVMEKMLFQSYSSISIWTYRDAFFKPMPLTFEAGARPAIYVEVSVAFVNPYSKNKELATAYLEEAAAKMEPIFLAQVCPGRNDPVPNKYYEENLNYYEEQIASIQAELEKAEGDQKADWETQLADWEGYLAEFMETGMWEASEESIAEYRTYGEYFAVREYFGLDNANMDEFYTQINQYMEGIIDRQTFLKNIDKKLKMMLMEGM